MAGKSAVSTVSTADLQACWPCALYRTHLAA